MMIAHSIPPTYVVYLHTRNLTPGTQTRMYGAKDVRIWKPSPVKQRNLGLGLSLRRERFEGYYGSDSMNFVSTCLRTLTATNGEQQRLDNYEDVCLLR